MKRRQFTRVAFRTHGEIRTGEFVFGGDIQDLSFNGMFIVTPKKLPIGTVTLIHIFLSGTTSELSVKLEGTIVRHDEEGMAVEFTLQGIELDSFVHLKNIIAYNQGSTETVEEEYFDFIKNR